MKKNITLSILTLLFFGLNIQAQNFRSIESFGPYSSGFYFAKYPLIGDYGNPWEYKRGIYFSPNQYRDEQEGQSHAIGQESLGDFNLGVIKKGSNDNLALRAFRVRTYKNPGYDICEVSIRYAVYQKGSYADLSSFKKVAAFKTSTCNLNSNSFDNGNIGSQSEYGPCNDQGYESWAGTIPEEDQIEYMNLVQGDYVLEVYFEVTGNSNSDPSCSLVAFDKNQKDIFSPWENYKISFSVCPNLIFHEVGTPSKCSTKPTAGYFKFSAPGITAGTYNYKFYYYDNNKNKKFIKNVVIDSQYYGFVENLDRVNYANNFFCDTEECGEIGFKTFGLEEYMDFTPAEITPTPVEGNNQNVCSGDIKNLTLADIAITGQNIKWYDVPEGGNALSISTLMSEKTYYASQTLNDCESVLRTAVTVSCNLSTNLFENINNSIRVYPNPVNDILTVQADLSETLEVEIVDLYGSVYQKRKVFKSNTVDFSNIAKGVYLVKLYSKNGTHVKKVVKN